MSAQLSEYELVRLENIKRNEEFLKSMGLYKDPNAPQSAEDAFKPAKKKPARKSVLKAVKDEDYVPLRRSSRSSASPGIKQEHVSLSDVENEQNQQPRSKRKYDPQSEAAKYFDKKSGDEGEEEGEEHSDDDEKTRRVVVKPEELRAFVDNVCPEHSEMISNAAIQLCAYRCAYMTLAALKNRVRAVSTGGGKKSHEKLLVVTYAMKAMGLHRLAEQAAGLLKRNTGLVAVFGDGGAVGGSSSGYGGGGRVKEEDVFVKAEGGVKVEGGVSGDIKMELGDDGVGRGSGVSSSSSSSCVIKTEPNTVTTTTSIDPLTTTTTATNTTSPRNKGTRTRGKSTISRIVTIDGASAIVYSGDGAGCVDSGSPARIKLEPISASINYTTRTADNTTTSKKSAHIDENDEPASVRKKRQKIQEIMEKIRQEEALNEVSSDHVVAVTV